MRPIPLTVVKGGLSRLRTKGSARPDNLFELRNGYVTAAKTVRIRPGTTRKAVLPGTKGVTSFQGTLHTFAASIVSVPAGFTLHVLAHPDATTDSPIALKRIHFAQPFLGFLYVVAEFVDHAVHHYWLQSSGAWQANHTYHTGDIVEPTTPNGLAYQASRLGSPAQAWAPNVPRTVGDTVEPTDPNDFLYTVIDTTGSNPTSGSVEPNWPDPPGQVIEETDAGTEAQGTINEPPAAGAPGQDIQDRYGRTL
jgi:hypothetical protein